MAISYYKDRDRTKNIKEAREAWKHRPKDTLFVSQQGWYCLAGEGEVPGLIQTSWSLISPEEL